METMLKLSEKRSDRKSKVKSEPTNVKKKRDWVAIVHKGCRVCMFRTFEGILAILGVTIISMVVGSLLIPNLTFSIASSVGITQSTDIYTACAVWLIPSLFFLILITAATFCILRKYIGWLHKKFSKVIVDGNERDEIVKGGTT